MRSVLISLVLCSLLPLAQAPLARAQDNSASVARARKCDAATAGKRMSNEEYRSFMRACLASNARPADLFESQRSIERRCNTIANDRQLTAQDRVTFMEGCRRKGG
ncbi:MAG TPA: hypothetical protein VMU67_10985 [Steroidobacteraceae bacterium]|nr:hypothetical protein [Steroidobacteraceae bacterium]